jgi:hypothetical protein
MPIDNRGGLRDENEFPTPAWDDIVQNSLGAGQAEIYEAAGILWDFYYQVYNGGIEGWIANRYFFQVHEVRRILRKVGGTATLEIENLLIQILPCLNFSFDPLMEPDNPRFYQQYPILSGTEWEIVKKIFGERISALKQEFRREGEEYFAAHWHRFN